MWKDLSIFFGNDHCDFITSETQPVNFLQLIAEKGIIFSLYLYF